MSDRNLSILIVDDSAADVFLLERALRRAGYQLTSECVSTIEGVCTALECRRWQLVISDFALPGLTGAEVAKLVRSRFAPIPVIVLTGMPEEAVREVSSGTPIVAKGDWQTLTATIERVVPSDPPPSGC